MAMNGEFEAADPKCAAYSAADPYFDLVRQALGDSVDGDHFFDVVSEGVIYEVLYDFPGCPRVIEGRAGLMSQFKGYGDNVELRSADGLISRRTDDGRAFVLEYEVHGTVLATGVTYDNRFCSIVVDREPKDRTLEGLYGLARSLECIDASDS
jgi:uncharacterized protein